MLDELPRNRNGKLMRDNIRDICLAKLEMVEIEHVDR